MKRRHSLLPEVYALVEQTPETVLLEGGSAWGAKSNDKHPIQEEPWTQLFTAPFRVCAAYEAVEIPALFAAIESAVAAGHTAAGFFSYECGACFEPKIEAREGWDGPLAWIGLYERSYRFDHATGEFAGGEPPGLERLRKAERAAGELSKMAAAEVEAEFVLSQAEYAECVAAIHEWIRAGDVYQLNFTAPWRVKIREGETGEGAAELYAKLRARQPVDYGAFVHWRPGRRILSFSPELFFRVDEEGGTRRITTRPMKGTAPRGRTTAEDRANTEWLRNDPKNRSENVMIVDLVRNDLGRLARFGSVRAEELFATERHPTLWQMTSTVTGELRPEIGFEHIFRAMFPCGSITGAPKVRAMQLIAGLESRPRGIYTGAIGFFSGEQTVFNVAIRTLDMEGSSGTMGVGSGIVIDSDAEAEYGEVMLKAEFLRSALGQLANSSLLDGASLGGFSLIESLLWDGGFPLIELHLDRLVDSAEYFGFACSREEVKAALEEHALEFDRGVARKVRLLLDGDGAMQITDEVVTAPSGVERIGRVRVARERTDSNDPLLFHKTTQRPLYARTFREATEAGLDDVLFLNERGEVTEGAISNVFLKKNGRWFTPPVACGLLAGVYRRYLMETRPGIEERVLLLDDLRTADSVHLANAVRGLRRVTIKWEDRE